MRLADRLVLALALLAMTWPLSAPGAAESDIAAVAWRVAQIAGQRSEGAGGLAVSDGRMSGQAACNRFSAKLIAGPADGKLELGPIASTRMYCDGKMTLEKTLLDALANVRRWRIDGTDLLLIDAAGTTLVRLAR
jgi:heat shock protein HslJ